MFDDTKQGDLSFLMNLPLCNSNFWQNYNENLRNLQSSCYNLPKIKGHAMTATLTIENPTDELLKVLKSVAKALLANDERGAKSAHYFEKRAKFISHTIRPTLTKIHKIHTNFSSNSNKNLRKIQTFFTNFKNFSQIYTKILKAHKSLFFKFYNSNLYNFYYKSAKIFEI